MKINDNQPNKNRPQNNCVKTHRNLIGQRPNLHSYLGAVRYREQHNQNRNQSSNKGVHEFHGKTGLE